MTSRLRLTLEALFLSDYLVTMMILTIFATSQKPLIFALSSNPLNLTEGVFV